uniref:Reverse transcriptase domain-containing protein n=1 Tax=Tanacetum cinerariifolium TaxID=118510 RepID=A0A699GVI7_TANCI|nr:reverse transcriptase domain-containing protein [Tanacetum cinerariifolium]
MSHRSSLRANDFAKSEASSRLQVATWLKTFEEFTRGWPYHQEETRATQERIMETDQGTSVPSESRSDTIFVYWKFESLIDLTHEKIKKTKGQAIAIAQPWEDLKKLLMEKYYPGYAIKELKEEFWNHVIIRADVDKYTTRFHELARLVLCMITPKSKRIDRYIRGLASAIRRNNGT